MAWTHGAMACRAACGAACFAAAVSFGGCHLPTRMDLDQVHDARLLHVQGAFEARVRAVKHSQTEDWYSGWFGNYWRNTMGGNRRGLCYEWQEVVYDAVREVAPREGLCAIGIMKDRDKSSEHHAVLLFEQGELTGPKLLQMREPRPAWVLDAWRYGGADMFTLDEWLGAEWRWRGRIEFEDLEAEWQERIAAGGSGNVGSSGAIDETPDASRTGPSRD